MADMSPITATVDGVSCTFKLLESDISTLTFNTIDLSVNGSASSFLALADATGTLAAAGYYPVQENGQTNYRFFPAVSSGYFPGFLQRAIDPQSPGFTMPTGKALLARAAARLAGSRQPLSPEAVVTTLALALKGGGMSLAAAAGAATIISRSSQSAPGVMSYVTNVLVPQILNAAASA